MRVVSQKDSASSITKSGDANMPSYDKPNNNHRPLVPSSSSTSLTNRGNKSKPPPLTPKLSARPTSRQSRSENTTPNNAKEDLSTPAATFLSSNNVTGRSSIRKTRFDGLNHSPLGTPTPSEPPRLYQDSTHTHTQNGSGLGIPGFEKDVSKRATVAFTPSSSDWNSSQSSADSKFFFASDAKPHCSQQSKPPPLKKTSSFYHANGDKVLKRPARSGSSTVGSTIGEERGHAKFFHANGTPELGLSPSPHFAPPRPSSVLSTSSRVTSPRLASSTTSPSQRPTSPIKLTNQYASISLVRSPTPLASPVLHRPKVGGHQHSANDITQSRRTSADGAHGHCRAKSSGSSIERHVLSSRVSSGGRSTDIPNPITITEPSSPASIAYTDEIPEGEEEGEEGESEDDEDVKDDDVQSVSSEGEVKEDVLKAGGSIERMNELAAIARNERKVLDLEITNSSLAAINRTLEREMRRQTAELRRYKRLSRSGRLSVATWSSSRDISGTLSAVDEKDGTTLSDISQVNSDLEDDEDEEGDDGLTSEEDAIDNGTLSPNAVAEHDLKHRKKDEKRLRLDLSKHQQLLIDSQKMNQSLKKCLGWTEELISEGKRALDYKVKTSDLGILAPRVLAPDEFDDNDVEIDNEGMSAIGASLLREARKAAAEQLKDKANHFPELTEMDELEDLTQDIQFALFASGESTGVTIEEKSARA
ncbi:hypothetical protein DSL72_001929 [Monilinia vaccinii-corymbosi]|uniref:Uncharacterized protein n=1 Tax=Monilinia vaccinii-corymbosi TaxID=61207 RepID=A0A8A3PB74_9HELO|nr:hypothetical protein DSL72_001929 [Monilinia vaccinii-corymbosi]